jgi:cyclophilin family peptidyl-prolyl cis-trans isomerase
VVVLKTNLGDIKIKMNAEKAPKTVENFLGYVKDGFYTNTVFHRVVPGFVVQGGGFEKGPEHKHVQKKVKDPVVNEASNGLSNKLGTISMARTRNPDSATSQFFLNIADNSMKLDPGKADAAGYAVFGEITEGLDVAQKIENLANGTHILTVRMGEAGSSSDQPMQNVPDEDAVILEAIVEGPKVVAQPEKKAEPAADKKAEPAAEKKAATK